MTAQEKRIQRQKPDKWQARPAMETKPPRSIMKVANVFMKRMLKGQKSKMGDMILLFTFTGRKSGKSFTTPIGYKREGNLIRSFTDSPWQKNLYDGAPVKVNIKGKESEGRVKILSNKSEVVEYVKGQLQKGGPQAARQMGLSLPKGYIPTDDELRIILRDRVLIDIELQ